MKSAKDRRNYVTSYTHYAQTKSFHNSALTVPSSRTVRKSLVIFWLPPRCPFISWQSASISGRYRGRDNIRETMWWDVSSAETLFSAPEASRRQTLPLSDNKAPACPRRMARQADRRTWKNYWLADKLFCYPNSLLSFCLSAHLHFQCLNLCLSELLSASLSFSSLYYVAFLLSHLWIIDAYRFGGKNRTVLEVTNGLVNRLHPPLFKDFES